MQLSSGLFRCGGLKSIAGQRGSEPSFWHCSRPHVGESATNRDGVSNWDDVQVGDRVQLGSVGRTEYVGEVDARTAYGDIIWVQGPVGGRPLFRILDGYELNLAAS